VKKLAIILGALALFVVQPVAGQFDTTRPALGEYAPTPFGDYLRWGGTYPNAPTFNGYVTGPYWGYFQDVNKTATSASFTLYCVDFANLVHQGSGGWTFSPQAVGSYSGALTNIHQAAFLSSLFSETNRSEWAAIHGAIWYLTGGLATHYASFGHIVDSNRNLEIAWWNARGWNNGGYDASNWYVLTPVSPSSQTMLVRVHSVPEPGVIVLLLSGLLGVAFVARRRASQL